VKKYCLFLFCIAFLCNVSVLLFGQPTTSASSSVGALFGDTRVEWLLDSNTPGQAEAFPVKATATGTINSLVIYLDSSSTAPQVSVGLYADGGNGHPGALMAQAGTPSPKPGAWNKLTLASSTKVVQGTRYWIAVLGTGGAIQFRDTNRGNCSSETSSQTTITYLGLPQNWTTGQQWSTCRMSAYGSGAAGSPVSVSVAVLPSSASLQVGKGQQFNANVSGSSNQAVSWKAARGSIDSSGMYMAPMIQGSDTVTATSTADPSTSASATVNVTAAASVSVTISPSTALLTTGGTQQFTATVSGGSSTGVSWSATGGSISASGLYTAPSTAGTYSVTASVAGQSASATVTVSAPTSVAVSVSPSTASLSSGGTKQFTATVTGTSNTGVTWSATSGSVSGTGLYTAPASAGNYVVTATSVADTTKSASATVTVTAAVAVAISISPSTASVATGSSQQFTATVTGTTNTAVTWAASGGSISAGMFTAPSTAGSFTVTATSVADSSKSASASVTVTDPPPTSTGTVGCGATTGGAAPYDQSQCGNVGGNFPAVGGTISACGSYTGIYTLSQDINSSASSVCLTVGTGSTINLGGHTVTGLIQLGDPASGTHVYNGTVHCSSTDDSSACIYGNLSGPMSAPLVVDHVTLLNTNTASGTNGQTLFLDWNPSSVSAAAPQVQFSYITSSAPAVPDSSRTGNIWINGHANWTADIHNVDLSCGPQSNACQGITLWAGNAHIYNSRITMSNVSLPQDGRGFICDGDSNYCEANNNYIDSQNNRAFRLREYNTGGDPGPLIWHDNLIDNIQNNITRAAIHLCDPDDTANTINANNAMFYNNTLNIGSGGTGVWAINCGSPGPVFKDNTIHCLGSGNCGTIAAPTADYGVATYLTVYDNTLDPGIAGPQSAPNTTVNYCNTGTCSPNGGACDLISPCPAQ